MIRIAQKIGPGRIDGADLAVRAEDAEQVAGQAPHAVALPGSLLDARFKRFIQFPELFLGSLRVGHVVDHAREPKVGGLDVADILAAPGKPANLPVVRPDDAQLQIGHLARATGPLNGPISAGLPDATTELIVRTGRKAAGCRPRRRQNFSETVAVPNPSMYSKVPTPPASWAMAEAFLDPLLLGDVDHDACEPDGPVVIVQDATAAGMHPFHETVRPQEPVLLGEDLRAP